MTFGAVGATCFPRNLDGKGRTDLLEDIDPLLRNVTDYQNVFDPWAYLGKDVGDSCQVGTLNVKDTRAYKWCKVVYGYTTQAHWWRGALGEEPLNDQFSRCIYFSHSMQAIIALLQDDKELLADGSTAGGCVAYAGWEKYSGKCPAQSLALAAGVIALIVILPSLLVFVVVGSLPLLWCYKKKDCCCKPYAESKSNSITNIEVA